MKNILSTLQFFTILPFGKPRSINAAAIPYFPVAGLVIGAIVAVGDFLFSLILPTSLVALLDVLLLAVLSGGLHIDGLGDTADGLLSHHSREQALSIMRDSRIGVMGVLSIVFILLIKWSSIQCLKGYRALILFVIPSYSRGAMMFGIRFLDYGRSRGGLGTDLFSRKPSRYALLTIFLPIVLSLLAGSNSIWLISGFFVMTASIIGYYKRTMGCITGDMLGAMTEIVEAFLLLTACSGARL